MKFLKPFIFLCFSIGGAMIPYLALAGLSLIEKDLGHLGVLWFIFMPVSSLIFMYLSFNYMRVIKEINSKNYLELRFLWGYPVILIGSASMVFIACLLLR